MDTHRTWELQYVSADYPNHMDGDNGDGVKGHSSAVASDSVTAGMSASGKQRNASKGHGGEGANGNPGQTENSYRQLF